MVAKLILTAIILIAILDFIYFLIIWENLKKLSLEKLEHQKKITIRRQLIYIVAAMLMEIYIIINNY